VKYYESIPALSVIVETANPQSNMGTTDLNPASFILYYGDVENSNEMKVGKSA